MPDINNSLAMQVNANPINLQSTIGTISQLQLAQAHAGLYGLQAQQEARKLAGFDYLKNNPTDYAGAIQAGLDPSVGSTLQQIGERTREYATNPQGLSTESTQQLTGAGKNIAETGKIQADTQNTNTDISGKIAQGVLVDPSNDKVWSDAVNKHYDTFGGSTLEKQQLLAVKDPALRTKIAASYAGQAVPPSDFTKPHNVPVTDAVTTPAAILGGPAAAATPAPAPSQGGMIPGGGTIIGGGAATQPAPASPNARVAQSFGTAAPAMSVGQAKESEGYGGELAKVLPALSDKANQSRQANFTLDQMRNESQSWDMGKGATTLMTAQQYIKPIANALGSDTFDKPVSDFESFQKNSGTLVRQAVKEVSSRAAVQEFNLIQKQLPTADMSRRGFNQIADQFQSVNDFNIAKQQAGQAYHDTTGTMDKFESDWNKNISPSAFLVARMPADQVGELKANLQRTPEGRATLNSITTQLQWAHDHNLDQLVR